MAKPGTNKSHKKGMTANVIVWTLLAILVLVAGVLALNVRQRYLRLAQETNQVRTVVQEAVRRQEMVVKAPARKEFSPAFLQMAFGDNPVLLEQVKEALSRALGENPTLAQGDVAMMLVTYRAEGELRDVAIQIFGNLIPERLPAFSTEGFWKGQLPSTCWHELQSVLTLLGREVVILASPDVQQRQRNIIEAGMSDRFTMIEDYLHDPVSFIAVIPEPGKLFTDRFRPYMAATLVKGKISLDEARVEVVALSFDPKRAQELAQMISDMKWMAVAVTRLRNESGPAEEALEQLQRVQVRAEGPIVTASGVVPRVAIERGLPRLIRALSKGVNRIKRGPGYPS